MKKISGLCDETDWASFLFESTEKSEGCSGYKSGIRRCGKSKLMASYVGYIHKTDSNAFLLSSDLATLWHKGKEIFGFKWQVLSCRSRIWKCQVRQLKSGFWQDVGESRCIGVSNIVSVLVRIFNSAIILCNCRGETMLYSRGTELTFKQHVMLPDVRTPP